MGLIKTCTGVFLALALSAGLAAPTVPPDVTPGVTPDIATSDAPPASPDDLAQEPEPAEFWRSNVTAQLVPVAEVEMPPALRARVTALGQQAVPRIVERMQALAARLPAPRPDESYVMTRRLLAWWFNRYAQATLDLPTESLQVLLDLQFDGAAPAGSCQVWPWTLPNWHRWGPALAQASPAQLDAWLGVYERVLNASIEGVPPLTRPEMDMPVSFAILIQRGELPGAPAGWTMPTALRQAFEDAAEAQQEKAIDPSLDCQLMHWWWQQVRSFKPPQRAAFIETYFWSDAEQMPSFYMGDKEVGHVAAVRGTVAYPGAAIWLEITGATEVTVTLGTDDQPQEARIVQRKHDFGWLGGDPPVIFEHLFDALALDTAMRAVPSQGKVKTVDGRRQVTYSFEWKLD